MDIKITQNAYDRLRAFVDLCKTEISGLGKVEAVDGTLMITDVEIFEQKVSAAHSTIEPDALAKFLFEKTKAGEKLSQWTLWWHSHAAMSAFFSGTDTGTIETSTEFPYLVSLVTNHEGQYKCRIDFHKPFRHTIEEVKLKIVSSRNEELIKEVQAEIEKKVSGNTVGFHQTSTTSHRRHGSQDRDFTGFGLPPGGSVKKNWWDDDSRRGTLDWSDTRTSDRPIVTILDEHGKPIDGNDDEPNDNEDENEDFTLEELEDLAKLESWLYSNPHEKEYGFELVCTCGAFHQKNLPYDDAIDMGIAHGTVGCNLEDADVTMRKEDQVFFIVKNGLSFFLAAEVEKASARDMGLDFDFTGRS